jgi:hypothetical protein
MSRSSVRIIAPRLTAALFVAALAGCQELTAPIADPPDFTGVVFGVDDQGIGLDSVNWSHRALDAPPGYVQPTEVIVNLNARLNGVIPTAVFVEDGSGKVAEGSVSQLAVGQRVKVWTTGVEWRTDPPQYDAVQIVIESGK